MSVGNAEIAPMCRRYLSLVHISVLDTSPKYLASLLKRMPAVGLMLS